MNGSDRIRLEQHVRVLEVERKGKRVTVDVYGGAGATCGIVVYEFPDTPTSVAQEHPATPVSLLDTILAADPQHLFGLFGAARAEELRGNAGAAQGMFQRFLDAYTAQIARDLPEYREHSQGLPGMRAAAQQAVGG